MSVCPSVGPLVRWSHFRISILSASLDALREKLKKANPNFFSELPLPDPTNFTKIYTDLKLKNNLGPLSSTCHVEQQETLIEWKFESVTDGGGYLRTDGGGYLLTD